MLQAKNEALEQELTSLKSKANPEELEQLKLENEGLAQELVISESQAKRHRKENSETQKILKQVNTEREELRTKLRTKNA